MEGASAHRKARPEENGRVRAQEGTPGKMEGAPAHRKARPEENGRVRA